MQSQLEIKVSEFGKDLRAARWNDRSKHDDDTDFLDQINSGKSELTQAQLVEIVSGGGKPIRLNPVCSARTGTEESVRSIIGARADRLRFLPSDLFADPAWDMLLDLYLNEILSKRISVSSLCGASNVPISTALRWIGALDCKGLIVRTGDRCDGRRVFIALSEAGLARMDAYFGSIQRFGH